MPSSSSSAATGPNAPRHASKVPREVRLGPRAYRWSVTSNLSYPHLHCGRTTHRPQQPNKIPITQWHLGRPAHGKDTQTLTPSRTPHSSPPPGDRQRRAAAGQVGHTHELALTLAPAPSAVCAESHRTPHVPHGDRYPTVAALMVSGLPTPGAHGQPSHSFISRLTSRERDADTHYTCLAPASHAPTHSLSLAVLSPRAHAPLTRHTHDVCSAGDDSGVELARGRVERRGTLVACPPALW